MKFIACKPLRRIVAPLAVLLASSAFSARAIMIDGHTRDWDSLQALPIPVGPANYRSALGQIDELKVAQDDDFIYVYLKFGEARPFASGSRQAKLEQGRWDDFSYVEIDRDGDGRWDFQTQMQRGKRIGVNNLAILGRIPGQQAGRIVLAAEGHKDYLPLGPRAFFSSDSQSVELRIPRVALRLQAGVAYIRARVHYRDDRSGSSQWETRYYPEGEGWVALELRPMAGRGEGSRSDSPSRLTEPVIPRSEFESEVGPRYARYPGPYTYPWRSIVPSADVSTRAADLQGTGETKAEGEVVAPPRSVIVVTPDGRVRQGSPGTSSPNPEEGQGVPGILESGEETDGRHTEIDE